MSSSEPSRIVRLAFALCVAAALGACGFHLRGDVDYAFRSVYVKSPGPTPIAAELKRALEGSGTKLVDTANAGEVILDLSPVVDDKTVLSLTGGGRVREYQLIKRVTFSLHDASGQGWMPAAEIVVRRTYSFNESEVLAREAQETKLYREMQTDAVQQIVRRLQAARKPA